MSFRLIIPFSTFGSSVTSSLYQPVKKARTLSWTSALGALWPEYEGSPLVVSGFLNTVEEARLYTDRLSGADITLCRLRVNRAELRARFLGRGWLVEQVDQALDEAEALERADVADFTVDTDGRAPADIAAGIRTRWTA